MADQFNSANSYVATPSPVQPAAVHAPAPWNLQPIGSEYASEFSTDETILIRRAIAREIFDAVPKKYSALRLLMDKPVQYEDNDVFTYLEKTFGRVALKAAGGVAAGATQAITMTTGGGNNVTINKVIVYPDNTKGIVKVVSGDVVTVQKYNGASDLTAVSTDDYFSIQTGVIADGQNFLTHYDRMSKIERYNYIQLMHRDKRWSRKEMQKFANLSNTNYYELDKKEQMDLLLQDMFISLWNGLRGEVNITVPGTDGSSPYKAMTMQGIFPSMIAAGSASASGVTKATLQESFETLCFETDYKAEGGVRFVFAQNALLYELSKAWKETGLRYKPDDKIGDLNLQIYKIGDMSFVPVATELFKEVSCFPVTWQHRIFVLDTSTIHPVCMQGYQSIELGQTSPKGTNGSIQDYTEWWAQGMLSLKFNNPLSSFYMDTTGIVSNLYTAHNPQ
ncbi:hypothetical protein LCGC14_0278390 [marine sediment metagenome]|uniref:Capsid protein n=1 Tax=marine sediment metagenome TaxID=412755 RepID=A0A0F9WHU9_9ZZZZ